MGADGSAQAVLGIRVPRGAFWKKTGTRHTCDEGHPCNSKWKNCPECGGRVAIRATEEPTEAFAALCAKLGSDPRAVWEEMRDNDGVLEDEKMLSFGAGFGYHSVGAVCSSEDAWDESVRALGFRVCYQGDNGGESDDDEVNAFAVSDLVERAGVLRRVVSDLLEGGQVEPMLFVSYFWSV